MRRKNEELNTDRKSKKEGKRLKKGEKEEEGKRIL